LKIKFKKIYFILKILIFSSGETEILILSRENAIEGWRDVIGPVDPEKAKLEHPNS